MPVKVKKIAGVFRVVESSTEKVTKNRAGTAVDGGGHRSRAAAIRQVNALNLVELRRAGRRDVPLAPRGQR